MLRRLRVPCVVAAIFSLAAVATPASEDPGDPDVRIRFYEAKLEQHPRLFAGFAELGAAYLDRARETHGLDWIHKAREALDRSLEIQPNLNASATMASLCNFLHRFECALEHARQLAKMRPDDPRILSLEVEANLGLGRLAAAGRLLDGNSDSFGAAAARGRWLAEQERYDEARDAFVDAATRARASQAFDVAVWAETNAAGMMIDSGRPEEALAHLESAAGLPAGRRAVQNVLAVHWAEYHALRDEPARALAAYEAILAEQEDPEIYRRAFVLARDLGRSRRAEELFAAGERAAERILDAGEIFALEAQARLYAAAGVQLDRAEELARQNLEHKQDRSARQTLTEVSRSARHEN